MSVSYKCTNPECGVTLKTPNRVAVGKSVKCPKCGKMFVPEPAPKEENAAGTLKLVDEPKKPEPPPVAPKKPYEDDDDEDAASVKRGYGVTAETEEEKAAAEKNKPTFTEVQDKFKKSARGPAMSLLVMPSNLLTGAGLLTGVAGLALFVNGMWPLVFNDAPPGEEEMEEAIVTMMMGIFTFFWGAMVCFGASQMQELSSYPWSLIGAIMGVVPLLVGIYCIVMLQNPKVKAGFEEMEGSAEEDEDDDGKGKKKEDDDDEDEDDDDDEDDEDDDDDDRPKKGKGRGKEKEKAGKGAKKAGKGPAKKSRGGDEDE
ncbi:hypothetical protein [Frigoriglobus tundricola]|uniref:Uncharacterized protein n=1 Tax=Frigoriglobus tundricola TaxID=2774151 RepID=A0A6M5YWV2_9BACT|nr:hypothetical protein [Frigoriglobus tundricola]QJW97980.1 hypothetical protein FTUN_5560 [Frigoriglobus tundricola]